MKFNVIVKYKEGILDPQGKTIHHSIETLGYKNVQEVKSGKYFQLEVDCKTEEEGLKLVQEVAGKLLANPNIQIYKVEPES